MPREELVEQYHHETYKASDTTVLFIKSEGKVSERAISRVVITGGCTGFISFKEEPVNNVNHMFDIYIRQVNSYNIERICKVCNVQLLDKLAIGRLIPVEFTKISPWF